MKFYLLNFTTSIVIMSSDIVYLHIALFFVNILISHSTFNLRGLNVKLIHDIIFDEIKKRYILEMSKCPGFRKELDVGIFNA